MGFAERAADAARTDLGKLADLLERQGISVDDIGQVRRINAWQSASKDADGEVQVTDLVGISFSPAWESGPKWPLVQPAKPVRVPARRATPAATTTRTALLVPDSQCGWIGDEPMHDDAALNVTIEMARSREITDIVLLGDMLDLAGMSRFGGPPTLARQAQRAIDYLHEYIAQLRAAAPHASISYIEGNHEARMAKTLAANAAEAFGLRRANVPDAWPVLSPPYLLRLDDLGVTYYGGYPNGTVWLREDIRVVHGSRTSADRASKDNVLVSSFQGHSHRLEAMTRTYLGRSGEIVPTIHVACGTTARIDGTVPSYGSGSDDSGRPVRSVENWQTGAVVVTYDVDAVGTLPNVELVPIVNGRAVWRGKAIDGNER